VVIKLKLNRLTFTSLFRTTRPHGKETGEKVIDFPVGSLDVDKLGEGFTGIISMWPEDERGKWGGACGSHSSFFPLPLGSGPVLVHWETIWRGEKPTLVVAAY
jgi:hypothetical protein